MIAGAAFCGRELGVSSPSFSLPFSLPSTLEERNTIKVQREDRESGFPTACVNELMLTQQKEPKRKREEVSLTSVAAATAGPLLWKSMRASESDRSLTEDAFCLSLPVSPLDPIDRSNRLPK